MSPRVLIFQHAAHCHPGTIGDHLAADGVVPTVVELNHGDAIPKIEAFDILMVMGGPQDVWEEDKYPWLVAEKAAIRRWVGELRRPYLGVCLGHQLLADALGGRVEPARKAEIGLLDIALNDAGARHALFSGFGSGKRAVQWHGAEVTALPAEGALLASSADCPISAFEVGRAAFGIQYHVEATDQSIRDWSASSPGSEMVRRLHGPKGASRVHAQVSAAMAELRSNSRRFYDNFMSIARRHLAR